MSPSVPTTPLPEDFTPSDHDVVIGKGKKFYFHAGNQWLRNVVADRIEGYSQAVTKADKSGIISKVVQYVNQNGRFVRLEPKTGQWVFAEPLLCREKCSQTFRDNLAQTYRSSNVAKRNKRRQQQEEDTPSYPVGMGMGFFTAGSSSDFSVEMPSAKRMRFEQPEEIISEVQSPAAWFDWEMPIRNLEADLQEESFQDFEDVYQMMTGPQQGCDTEEPFMLDFIKSFGSPMKDFSASNMGMENNFRQRTAAAFAA